jgi:hypothetical protein
MLTIPAESVIHSLPLASALRGGCFSFLVSSPEGMTMNQIDFNRAVAKATGESAGTIARRGFVLLTPVTFEREPHRLDYDDFLEGVSASAHPQASNRARA